MPRRAEVFTDEELAEVKADLLRLGRISLTGRLRDVFFTNSRFSAEIRQKRLNPQLVFPQLLSTVRVKNALERFGEFFQTLPNRSERISNFFTNILPRAKEYGSVLSDLFPEQGAVDLRLTNKCDQVGSLLEEILKDPKLSQDWMKEVDTYVQESTKARLKEIDEASETDKYAFSDVTIVGDGPAAINAAILLSTYCKVTLIWNGERLCDVWRSRLLQINSSVRKEKPNVPRFPLVGNPTALFPDGWPGAIDISNLLSPADLTIQCKRGDQRRYMRGKTLGEALATEAVLRAEYFIKGQHVDFTQTTELSDGTSIIEMTDIETGKKRKHKQGLLLVMTGPGGEVTKVPGKNAQKLSAESPRKIDQILNDVRQAYKDNQPYVYKLPLYLNFSQLQKLYACWQYDLNKKPDYYPFSELLNKNQSIGIFGSGDTALVVSQFFIGTGPGDGYINAELSSKDIPGRIKIYNQSAANPDDFAKQERPRYVLAFSEKDADRIVPESDKVADATVVEVGRRGTRTKFVRVTTQSNRQDFHSYVIDATGISSQKDEDQFPQTFKNLIDVDGNVVARSSDGLNMSIIGTAAKFDKLPSAIESAISLLGINENPVALWANMPLVLRAVWTLMYSRVPINSEYVNELLDFIQNQAGEQGEYRYADLESIENVTDLLLASINPSVTNQRKGKEQKQFDDSIEPFATPLINLLADENVTLSNNEEELRRILQVFKERERERKPGKRRI